MTSTHLVTVEELLTIQGDSHELWEGELIDVSPSGGTSSGTAFRLGGYLFAYAEVQNPGFFTNAEGGFILSHDPPTVVMPDIGFVTNARFPEGLPKSLINGAPDLAIEIISPTDEPGQIRRKQRLYEHHKVPLVWWIDPEAQTVTVFRSGRDPEVLSDSSALDGGDILSGFTLPVEKIFAIKRM